MKRVKPQHLSLHDEMIICDNCGEKTDIYVTIGDFKYCSTICKEQADSEAFSPNPVFENLLNSFSGKKDSDDADKYDDLRDIEIEDSFEDNLNLNV